MPPTLDVYETRRENLSRLLKEPGAKTQLAARLGASQSHITHLLKPPTAASARAIREETARQIEEIMGLAMGQLDKPAFQPDVTLVDSQRRHAVVEVKTGMPMRRALRGTGEPPALYSSAEIQQTARVHQADPALLEDAFRLVLEAVVERGEHIPPEKAAKLARLVYEQAQVTGKVDPSLVVTLINLMS